MAVILKMKREKVGEVVARIRREVHPETRIPGANSEEWHIIWRHLLRNLAQSFLSFGVENAEAAHECLQVLPDCFGGDGVRTVAAVTIIIESSLVDLDRSQDLGLDVAQLQATAPDLLGGRDWNEVEVWRCS